MTRTKTHVLRSLSFRLALGYALLFGISSMLLLASIWWRNVGYLDREINAVILADTRAIADQFDAFGVAGAVQAVNDRVAKAPDVSAIYLLTDPFLNPLAGNLSAWPLQVDQGIGWHEMELVRNGKLRATRILRATLPGGFHLLVGRDIQEREEREERVFNGLIWDGIIVLVLGTFGGYTLRRILLTRIDSITATTAAIVRGDLSRRVPVRGTDDEFDHLTGTINQMLDQIQALIEGVRNVSNAIAHDLRTPLAEARARLEELLRHRRPDGSTHQTVEATISDIDRLIGMFDALLRLAEIDSGVRRSGFTTVDVGDVIEDVVELYGPTAETRGIALVDAAGPGIVTTGDPYLLAQAVGNLVDNALKYTPAGGTVTVGARVLGDGIEIEVADNGPGIPEAERERVTERFYRGDASRGTEGVGLGLSLTAAVARLHGGELELGDNAPGLKARIRLPSSVAAAGTAAKSPEDTAL